VGLRRRRVTRDFDAVAFAADPKGKHHSELVDDTQWEYADGQAFDPDMNFSMDLSR
jgi:hypothetical protein